MAVGPEERRSARLVFAYDEQGIRLVGVTHRSKPPPRGRDPRREAPDHAITLDLRSADGTPLHRQILRDPIPQTVEVFDDQVPRRVPQAPPSGAFSAVVPLPDEAVQVVVEAGPDVVLTQPAFAAPATAVNARRELARIDLPRRS